MNQNTIIIIGKYSLNREGLVRVLQEKSFRIQELATDADHVKSKVRAPHALFLIVYAGEEFEPIVSDIAAVRSRYPEAHVAVVADRYGATEPAAAFKAGANGYLASAMSSDAFVKSIELVLLGEAVFPPSFAAPTPPARRRARRPRTQPAPPEDDKTPVPAGREEAAAPLLSPREMAILRCLIGGNSNKSIARMIDIAEATVKAHIKAILRKIRVQNRTQAAIWGMNNALLLQPANSNAQIQVFGRERPASAVAAP